MSRSRAEFPKAVRVAVIKRATDAKGVIRCEECHDAAKAFDIDHINPDAMTGEPTLENAKLLCKGCHLEKTKLDVKNISKAKRQEAGHLRANVKPSKLIQSPGFRPSGRRKENPMKMMMGPRQMYEDA